MAVWKIRRCPPPRIMLATRAGPEDCTVLGLDELMKSRYELDDGELHSLGALAFLALDLESIAYNKGMTGDCTSLEKP